MAQARSGKSKRRRAAKSRKAAKDVILQRNLAALRATRPELAEIAAVPPNPDRIRMERDASGQVVNIHLRTPEGEKPWFLGDPDAELDALWQRTDWHGASMLFAIGVGFGRELQRLMTLDRTRLRRLIIIEPDVDVFRAAMRSTQVTGLLMQDLVEIHVGLPMMVLTARLMDYLKAVHNLRYVKTLTLLAPEASARYDAEFVGGAVRAIKQAAVEALQCMGNSPQDALLGLENELRNLGTIVSNPGVSVLKDQFKGKPAVICSAGPSLAKSFDVLREIQDDVVLLCPDTSLKPLRREGIEPHLVTSRERTPRTKLFFEGHKSDKSWLAGVPVLDPRCYDNFEGPSVSIFRSVGHFLWLGLERGIVDFNGSASNLAYNLAQAMGCSPIILVGQDLSFAPDGSTHVGGAATGSRQKAYDGMAKVRIPGNSGRPVLTTKPWLGFLHHFEYDIAQSEHRTINTAMSGAVIRGAEVMELADAAKTIGPANRVDARSKLRKLLAPPTPERAAEQARFVEARLRQTYELAEAIIACCDDGIEGAQAAQGQEPPPVFKALPADVMLMLNHDPLKALHKLRTDVIHKRMFQEFVTPTAQAFMVHWEVDFYALQRTSKNGAELYKSILPKFVDWFRRMRDLTQISMERLAYGERSLYEAFPDVVSPPSHDLPERTMLDIYRAIDPSSVPEHAETH